MKSTPEVSVVTATYGDGPYLTQAVESILNQTFGDFEYIIIDDGSVDETPEILAEYAARDARIFACRHERNMGRAVSRNHALELARGKWVAIFDGDDISHPRRLEKQLGYLKAHAEVDYMGTGCHHINKQTGESMPERVFDPPLTHGQTCWRLCFDFPFHHSSTIGRRDWFLRAGGYPSAYPVCEDIFLWMAMVNQGARFANIPEQLLTYRVNTKPKYYALNQVIAQNLHRSHVSRILGTNIPEAVFSIIWQTNAAKVYEAARGVDATCAVEAIRILTMLYRTLQENGAFDSDGEVPIQADLLQRIGKVMMIAECVEPRCHEPEYLYTYHLAVVPELA